MIPDDGPMLYLVTRGMISLEKVDRSKTSILSVIKEGSLFGYEDLLHTDPNPTYSVTSRALIPSTITALAIDLANPDWQKYIFRNGVSHLVEQTAQVGRMSPYKSKERVASALLDLSTKKKEVPVTQEIIAQRSGNHRGHLNELIVALSDEGIISLPTTRNQYQQDVITIIDEDALRHRANRK